jgi:predicted RecA/RadA family phage recombinase
MAEATMYAEGGVIDYTPGGALAAGEVVPFTGFVGISKRATAAGELTALAIQGVFKVTKQTGVAWTRGDVIYWDNAANQANKTAGGNTRMGVTTQDAASGDTVGYVKIYPNL